MNSRTVIVVSPKQQTAGNNSKRQRPTNGEVASRAYELFQLRGASDGGDVEDWLQAERELLERN
jgi:hypothetical protein